MAYSLHIERKEGIALDEWLAAVESIDGIRIDIGTVECSNSNTNESI
ncbi:hypothetical protein [Photobacterium kasasachensis]